MFAIVKRYFNMGLYDVEAVGKFARVGKITAEEFKTITGQEYEVI